MKSPAEYCSICSLANQLVWRGYQPVRELASYEGLAGQLVMETTRATFALSGATVARDRGCRGDAWACLGYHILQDYNISLQGVRTLAQNWSWNCWVQNQEQNLDYRTIACIRICQPPVVHQLNSNSNIILQNIQPEYELSSQIGPAVWNDCNKYPQEYCRICSLASQPGGRRYQPVCELAGYAGLAGQLAMGATEAICDLRGATEDR